MRNLLFALFLLLTSSVQAQNDMNGILYGKVSVEDGNPLPYATVKIDGTSIGAVTDNEGRYNLTLPYGQHTIVASFIGFKTISKTIEINATNFRLQINFRLKETPENLNEVQVFGKTVEREIETEGFAVNVVDTKEASLRSIQANELLNTTVGVKIRQNGGLGSNVEYSLNGLSGSAVRIFIDGIPISAYGSSFNLNSIPPSMIERIEVYKGVVPGHLASDALGGAINIILNKESTNNFNTSVSYGSFNTFQANANGTYRLKESGLTVKGSLFHNYSDNNYEVSGRSVVVTGLGGVQTPVTAERFNDAYRSTGGMLHLGYTDVKWADQFFLGFTGSRDYKEVQHGAFMTIMPYEGRFLKSNAKLANFTYQKKDFLVRGLDINMNGLYGTRDRSVTDTIAWAYSWNGERAIDFRGDEYQYSWKSQQEGGPTLAKIDRKVASIRTGISYTISENQKILFNHVYSGIDREDSDELRAVLENTFRGTRDLYKNIISATYEINTLDNKLKTNLFGKYYLQKTVNIDPEINTETGRIEDDITVANVRNEGYGITLSYTLFPSVVVLSSAEKAIRLPNESEVFGNDGDNVVANPSIRPELSNNLNLGFRLGTFRINKHGVDISTNFFTRNIKDRIGLPIETSLNINDEIVLYENQGSGTSKGFEAQVDYRYNNNLGFNFNISRFDLKIMNRGVEIDVPNTPFFTMNANLRYSFEDIIQKDARLNLFYTLYFTDEFSYLVPQGSNTVGDDFFKIPMQLTQDFGINYVFPNNRFIASFDVKNIFDKPVYDNLSVQRPGRAFYLKINYRINKF